MEGLGGGGKKWQFQFPGTYNTDAKEGRRHRHPEKVERKGAGKEGEQGEQGGGEGEEGEGVEERRDLRRDIGASSPYKLPETVQYSAKQMQTFTILYIIRNMSLLLLIFLYGAKMSRDEHYCAMRNSIDRFSGRLTDYFLRESFLSAFFSQKQEEQLSMNYTYEQHQRPTMYIFVN